MKKILLLFMSILAFTSCSKDDKTELTLSTNNITLYTEGTEQITASEKAEWSSDSEFIAKVDKSGVITGSHVGKTFITATSDNGTAKCGVEVKAKYNTFTEPVLEFGASKSAIKSKESRTLNVEKTDNLLFNPDKSTIKGVAYLFENGEMTSAGVFVNMSSSLEATDFLIERYLVVGAGSGDIVGLMLNNQPNKATMSIAMSVESEYVLVIYMPYKKNKTRSTTEENITVNRMKELFNNMK